MKTIHKQLINATDTIYSDRKYICVFTNMQALAAIINLLNNYDFKYVLIGENLLKEYFKNSVN